MLASAAVTPPDDRSRWIIELKYDGYRGLAAKLGSDVALWSRNGKDLLERFPGLEKAVQSLRADDVVLDGEIVAFGGGSVPRFDRVQGGSSDARYVAFDLLRLEGVDLRAMTIEERRRRLERLLEGGSIVGIEIGEILSEAGEAALEVARRRGFEGIVAKRVGSGYENGRSRRWVKVKAVNEQELVVVGYTPSRRGDFEIGALLVAWYDGERWQFAGRVGTGFTAAQRKEYLDGLATIRVDASPLVEPPRIDDAIWVEPRLVAQVRFAEWTPDGLLRHPSFVGFRTDRDPQDVRREPARPADAPSVTLTTPDRVLYPRDGIRKIDLATYYDELAGPIIGALRGRPTGLEHWNGGIDGDSWFQQDLGRDEERWMTVAETPLRSEKGRAIRHLVVDRREALRWLAQRSVLSIHVWASRKGSLESPDWVVFDLDPAEGRGIEQAIEAANVFRGLFDQLGIPSVPKTTGKRGLHLVVFLEKGHRWDDVAQFAERVSAGVARSVDGITIERSIGRRRGRLYADHLQNAYGKMIVAPYSPRGVDGAPVSTPLRWDEVATGLDPSRFNVRTMMRRLEEVGDLWAEASERKVNLPKLS